MLIALLFKIVSEADGKETCNKAVLFIKDSSHFSNNGTKSKIQKSFLYR